MGGLGDGALFLEDPFVPPEAVDAFFFFTTSDSLSLLSLKMLLYLSTVLRFVLLLVTLEDDLGFVEDELTEEVFFVKFEAGVGEGLTEGEAWDPGEDEAAMAFLAC